MEEPWRNHVGIPVLGTVESRVSKQMAMKEPETAYPSKEEIPKDSQAD